MASMNNVTLKKLIMAPSRDGYYISCDIYIGKRRVASYLDIGDGGEPEFTYKTDADREFLRASVEIYYNNPKHPPKKYYLNEGKENEKVCWFNSICIFIEELINLIEDEKYFVKSIRQGYAGIIVEQNFGLSIFWKIPFDWSNKKIQEFIDIATKDGKMKSPAVYLSRSDFEIA